MVKLLILAVLVLIVFLVIVVIKTLMFKAEAVTVEKVEPPNLDREGVITRLSEAIQFCTTTSHDPSGFAEQAFIEFQGFLEDSYPLVHQKMERELVNGLSLLYKWAGTDDTLKPVLFIAHYDVVPVEPGTEKNWSYDAFSGEIAEGYIWGRGAVDMKSILTAQMEAAETLIKENFQPKRTIYFAFGHDEEIGGNEGAAKIAELLKSRDIRIEFTIDEGMMILNEDLSPTRKPLAIIALAEKGYLTLKLTARADGGHSSMPHSKTAVGSLGKAVSLLEQHQMPASLNGVAGQLFASIGSDMPLLQRALFANPWLFQNLILKQLKKQNLTNAIIRTTTAPTIISGGIKENILPKTAYALVNFRLLPGDKIEDIVKHVRQVINDPKIEITKMKQSIDEASPVSSTEAVGYQVIRKSIHEIFPGVSVAPGLEMGGTDSKHYIPISDNCYRFAPILYGPSDLERIHGTDERIEIEGYLDLIRFYIRVVKNAA